MPARAGLSGRAGNGRAPGPRPRPARGPALPGSPPGPATPPRAPAPKEAPPAVQHPRALKRRTCGPASGPTRVHVPHVSCCPTPTTVDGGKGRAGGPEQCGWPLSGPGRRHLSRTPRERRALLSGQHPSPPPGVGLRPPGTPRSSPRARDPEGPTETHHRITRKHTGLRANHSSQREHWRLRPAI